MAILHQKLTGDFSSDARLIQTEKEITAFITKIFNIKNYDWNFSKLKFYISWKYSQKEKLTSQAELNLY